MTVPTKVTPPIVRWHRTQAEIEAYRRKKLTVDSLLNALDANGGAVLLSTEVGLGKTTVIDRLVERQLATGTPYGLIAYLTSRRDVLAERPWLPRPNASHDEIAVLVGRPRSRCGPLDPEWTRLEKASCGAVGRSTLCARCSRRRRCPWPEQMKADTLAGKSVVAGVQSFLVAVPSFVSMLVQRADAGRVLIVIDEAFIVDAGQRERLDLTTVKRSEAVFQRVATDHPELVKTLEPWLALHGKLIDQGAPLDDLPKLPWLLGPPGETLQRVGLDMFGDRFRYLGFDLLSLARGPHWRDGSDIMYIKRPRLRGADYLVAAAHLPLPLVRHRLNEPDLAELYPGDRFLHEGTRFYNLRASLGAARYYTKNAPQICFCYAQLIARLAKEGKRTLCIVKKCFTEYTASLLEHDLQELTGRSFRVVGKATQRDLADPLVVPLISYGAQGLNCYAGLFAAICFSSFYTRQEVIDQRLNEGHVPGEEVPLAFAFEGGRRRARPRRYWDHRAGYAPLVEGYEKQYESNVVIQALGRVRFATQPRLVITFQRTPPDYPLTGEFRTLADLRRHFGLLTRRRWRAASAAEQVAALAARGMTPTSIMATTGLGRSSVYEILRKVRPAKPKKILPKGSLDTTPAQTGDDED